MNTIIGNIAASAVNSVFLFFMRSLPMPNIPVVKKPAPKIKKSTQKFPKIELGTIASIVKISDDRVRPKYTAVRKNVRIANPKAAMNPKISVECFAISFICVRTYLI